MLQGGLLDIFSSADGSRRVIGNIITPDVYHEVQPGFPLRGEVVTDVNRKFELKWKPLILTPSGTGSVASDITLRRTFDKVLPAADWIAAQNPDRLSNEIYGWLIGDIPHRRLIRRKVVECAALVREARIPEAYAVIREIVRLRERGYSRIRGYW